MQLTLESVTEDRALVESERTVEEGRGVSHFGPEDDAFLGRDRNSISQTTRREQDGDFPAHLRKEIILSYFR